MSEPDPKDGPSALGPSGSGPERAYSKAFEAFVQDEDDLEGLLAYALYKQTIWQSAHKGLDVRGPRNPPDVLVRRLRESAENLLWSRVTDLVDERATELQQSAALTAIENARNEIKTHVTERTKIAGNLLGGLLTNLAAWVITIILTIAIVKAYEIPDVPHKVVPISPSNGNTAT